MRKGLFKIVVCVAGLLASSAVIAWRARAAAPAGRYVVNAGAQTVLDTVAGLTWRRDFGGPMTWSDATAWCAGPNGPGSPWRLPTIHEIQTIADTAKVDRPLVDTTAFPLVAGSMETFWTSTTYSPNTVKAWSFHPYDAYGGYYDKTVQYRVRCVR